MVNWEEAQKHEANYWGNCHSYTTWGEYVKGEMYGREMGLFDAYGTPHGELDMRGRSVLDVGGGPVSMTLRCVNANRLVVADPCDWPPPVQRRYKNYGIEFMRLKGEDLAPGAMLFDEVLCYNVLQHVDDPALVLKNALSCVAPKGVFRIFEWIHIPADACHPHVLTPENLLNWLSGARILKVRIPHIKDEYWSNASAFVGVFQP